MSLSNDTYEPTLPAIRSLDTAESLREFLVWLDREHFEIARVVSSNLEGYEVYHTAPDKLRIGMVRYADGTNWNPDGVSGEGLYIYKSTGWVLIA